MKKMELINLSIVCPQYERCLFDKVKIGFDKGAILEEWLHLLDAMGGVVEG